MPKKMALMIVCLIVMLVGRACAETPAQAAGPDQGLLSGIHSDWGGHLRTIGTVSALDEDSVYPMAGSNPYYDGQIEWRLKNRLGFGSRWTLQTHYELVGTGGDTSENTLFLERTQPFPPAPIFSFAQPIGDDRRLFDLTHVLTETDRYLIYHRLDRLNLTYTPDWGTLRLGRQALTWGDGLIFNPMDLFNPFAPTTVQRDYKIGEDMAYAQLPIGLADMQVLYLPRRDLETGDIEADESSYAMKYHTPAGPVEMDIMAAGHYGDGIGGLGASGYLGQTAWRINTVYTHLAKESDPNDFFQIVANVDYAWMWGGRNVYGLLEFYYNGLGLTGNYESIVTNRTLLERLARGELFTIGRYYMAGQVQIELHPLLHLHTTAIVNLSDPSGILQPQVLWDIISDWQVILGAQWNWGGDGSEFGGYDVTTADATFKAVPADRIYLWLTYYF